MLGVFFFVFCIQMKLGEFICVLLNAGVQHGRRILAEVRLEW